MNRPHDLGWNILDPPSSTPEEVARDRGKGKGQAADPPPYRCPITGAGGGSRTRTALSGQGILSPLRLPVSPLRHEENGQGMEATVGFEPTNEAFAEPSLNHLGTSPHDAARMLA